MASDIFEIGLGFEVKDEGCFQVFVKSKVSDRWGKMKAYKKDDSIEDFFNYLRDTAFRNCGNSDVVIRYIPSEVKQLSVIPVKFKKKAN